MSPRPNLSDVLGQNLRFGHFTERRRVELHPRRVKIIEPRVVQMEEPGSRGCLRHEGARLDRLQLARLDPGAGSGLLDAQAFAASFPSERGPEAILRHRGNCCSDALCV